MSARRRSPSGYDRGLAMSARPCALDVVSRSDRADGGLVVTVNLPRPRWQRWLGGSDRMEHSFGLDAFGREVFEACDGQKSVREMISRFARDHSLSQAEAQISVTTFLRTLLVKGLVVMEVDRKRESRGKQNG